MKFHRLCTSVTTTQDNAASAVDVSILFSLSRLHQHPPDPHWPLEVTTLLPSIIPNYLCFYMLTLQFYSKCLDFFFHSALCFYPVFLFSLENNSPCWLKSPPP